MSPANCPTPKKVMAKHLPAKCPPTKYPPTKRPRFVQSHISMIMIIDEGPPGPQN